MFKRISLKNFLIISIIFSSVIGVLLHFLYEWSNRNFIVSLFSSVNESTWEHLKILFFSMLITTIIGYFYYKDINNYLCSSFKGILFAMFFIVVFFYTYTGVFGISSAFINILSFIISIILGELYAYKNILKNECCNKVIPVILLVFLVSIFSVFTFNPPHIGLFLDPVTKTYGIND